MYRSCWHSGVGNVSNSPTTIYAELLARFVLPRVAQEKGSRKGFFSSFYGMYREQIVEGPFDFLKDHILQLFLVCLSLNLKHFDFLSH